MRILKINTLPKVKDKWVDRDIVMLHACFQILVDCIEKENLLTHCNYESHKESIDEATALYKWWHLRCKRSYKNNITEEDTAMLLRLMNIRSFLWT